MGLSELENLKSRIDAERISFLRAELCVCFTFADCANTHIQMREPQRAEENLAHAETGYSTLVKFLDDPKHANNIPLEVQKDLRSEMERLRQTLDQMKPALTAFGKS